MMLTSEQTYSFWHQAAQAILTAWKLFDCAFTLWNHPTPEKDDTVNLNSATVFGNIIIPPSVSNLQWIFQGRHRLQRTIEKQYILWYIILKPIKCKSTHDDRKFWHLLLSSLLRGMTFTTLKQLPGRNGRTFHTFAKQNSLSQEVQIFPTSQTIAVMWKFVDRWWSCLLLFNNASICQELPHNEQLHHIVKVSHWLFLPHLPSTAFSAQDCFLSGSAWETEAEVNTIQLKNLSYRLPSKFPFLSFWLFTAFHFELLKQCGIISCLAYLYPYSALPKKNDLCVCHEISSPLLQGFFLLSGFLKCCICGYPVPVPS